MNGFPSADVSLVSQPQPQFPPGDSPADAKLKEEGMLSEVEDINLPEDIDTFSVSSISVLPILKPHSPGCVSRYLLDLY